MRANGSKVHAFAVLHTYVFALTISDRPTVSLEESVVPILPHLIQFAKCMPGKVLKRLSSEVIVNEKVLTKRCKMVETRVP